MAVKRIPIYGQIKACSIYAMTNGVASSEPAAIDATITPPDIQFESGTIQMMGSLTMPDHSRLGDLSLSITVPPSKHSINLAGKGLKEYRANWAQEVTDPSGAVRVVGGVLYMSGYVTQVPSGGSKNPGAEGTADYNVSLVKFRQIVDGEELYNIDRASGKLIINGEDYRSDVDELL